MAEAPSTITTLATLLPTLVAGRVNYYFDRVKVYRGLIGEQYRYKLTDAITIWVSQNGSFTFAAIGEGANTESTALTTTKTILTPLYLGFTTTSSLYAQGSTPIALAELYAEAAGYAWAYLEDDDSTYGFSSIAAADASSTNNLGASGTPLTASLCRQGAALIMAGGAKRPYNWCIGPTQFNELMADPEAKQWLMNSRGQSAAYVATVGVDPDRYLGQIYGVHVWLLNTGYSSSGIHSIMFGQGALGQAYKLVSTPSNPTPAEMHMSVTWQEKLSGDAVFFRVCMDSAGISGASATNNLFISDIIS